MPAELLVRFIEFAVRTAILAGLLWLMNKLQKLNQRFEYRFLKLMGAAALASGLDMVPYVGHCLAVPVLLVSVKKVTRVDYIEALFTTAISYALVFGLNLFLLGSLMENLRVRVENSDVFEAATRPRMIKAEKQAGISTNPPVLKTNLPVPSTPTGLARPAEPTAPETVPPVPMTNPPAQSAPTNLAVQPAPVKPAENLSKYFSVKGVTRNGANSAVTIQTGARTYTVFLEEAVLMQTVDGPISVRFAELGQSTVTLEINGEPAKFPIPQQ